MNLELEDYYRSVSSMDISSSSSSSSMEVHEPQHQQQQSPPHEHLCYVRCTFCSTVLAVGIPVRRYLETVTVKCGHCSHLSFMSTRPPLQGQYLDPATGLQATYNCSTTTTTTTDFKRGQSSSSSTSSAEPMSPPQAPFVVKPPEKKHRLPSAYNRFMKEEIQRIKAANPEIPHREAFSAAAKNWARYIPHTANGSISDSTNINVFQG